jgi:hypothetical protein
MVRRFIMITIELLLRAVLTIELLLSAGRSMLLLCFLDHRIPPCWLRGNVIAFCSCMH